jgi:hypothetical protein
VCRKQKLRCGGRDELADGSCQRCRNSGIRCIFDTLGPRKRKKPSGRIEDEPTSILEPSIGQQTSLIRSYEAIQNVQRRSLSVDPGPGPSNLAVTISPDTENQDYTTAPSERSTGSHLGLSLMDLQAPVKALHNKTTDSNEASSTTQPVRIGSKTPIAEDTWNSRELPSYSCRAKDDLTSSCAFNESEARNLFNLYAIAVQNVKTFTYRYHIRFMSSVSNLLPIFDPIKDSFDSLRRLEPFCFAVILAIARRVEGSSDIGEASNTMWTEDVRRFIASSMSQYPASLGDVQAVVLLAAYSEKTWYMIGHALQMAIDLKLDKALSRLDDLDSALAPTHSKERKQLMRQARIWLALSFMEREIAMGMAKPSRTESIRISHLRRFAEQPQSQPSDMRLVSLVEAVQIRSTPS